MAISSRSETSKKLSRLFAVLIVLGLILTVLGYFGPIVKQSGAAFDKGLSITKLKELNEQRLKEEDPALKGLGGLKVFANVSFILGIVTIVWFVLLCVLFIDNPELIYIVIGGLTVLSAIFVFIFTFIILSNFKGGAVSYVFGYGGIFLPLGGLLLGGGTAGMALTTPKIEILHQ